MKCYSHRRTHLHLAYQLNENVGVCTSKLDVTGMHSNLILSHCSRCVMRGHLGCHSVFGTWISSSSSQGSNCVNPVAEAIVADGSQLDSLCTVACTCVELADWLGIHKETAYLQHTLCHTVLLALIKPAAAWEVEHSAHAVIHHLNMVQMPTCFHK
jgi:hypothetical protein